MHEARLRKVLNDVQAEGLDGLMVLPGPNMTYLTGFTTKSLERFTAAIYPSEGEQFIVVPKLDEEKASKLSTMRKVYAWTDEEGPIETLRRSMKETGLTNGTVGCEGSVTLSIMETVKRAVPGIEFRNVSSLLQKHRVVKDEEEIQRTKEASKILEKAMRSGMETLHEGLTERDVGFHIAQEMIRLGADQAVFCMVQSGPNSAMPHHEAGERKIRNGDAIVIDCVCNYKGYHADITRSLMLGGATDEYGKIYRIVLDAQENAIKSVKPDVSAQAIDGVARQTITRQGYGQFFIHRTGHGLGLEVHEDPHIRQGNPSPVVTNMIFTVEPGIYVPGKFGIRIEDNIIVAKDGCEDITTLPKAPPN